MSRLGEQAYPTAEPINFGLFIFGPISSVPGSATISFFQPLLTGKVFASAGIIIGAELFLFLAQRLFRLESLPICCPEENGHPSILRIPISELQVLLSTLAKSNNIAKSDSKLYSSNFPPTLPKQTTSSDSFLTTETAETPMIVSLAIVGDYSNIPFSTTLFFSVPIFTLPGIRGALPLLILATLGTIFIRSVVPPEAAGSKPLKQIISSDPKPLQFNAEDLMKLLIRFGKYFGSQ